MKVDKTKIKSVSIIEQTIAVLLLSSVIIFIINPDLYLFKKAMEFANHILILLLLLSFIFLVLDNKRLILSSVLSVGLLAFFLNSQTKNSTYLENNNLGSPMSIVLIDIDEMNIDGYSVNGFFDTIQADIVIIQNKENEISDQMLSRIDARFNRKIEWLNEQHSNQRVYSKFPIQTLDYTNSQALSTVGFKIEKSANEEVTFYSCHFDELSAQTYRMTKDYLEEISKVIDDNGHNIVLGELAFSPWSNEINYLKKHKGLNNSELENPLNVFTSLVNVASLKQLLYSSNVVCVDFKSIVFEGKEVGIRGTYKFGV